MIDNAPLSTPIPVDGGAVLVGHQPTWSKWFSQIVTALFRPTVTKSLSFPLTVGGHSSDVAVAFPRGTVGLNDIPVLGMPAPPANTCFSCHIVIIDQVVVRFNNYGAAAASFAPAIFSITVLKQ